MTWLCKNKTLWVGAKLQGYLFYWKATSLLQEKVGDVLHVQYLVWHIKEASICWSEWGG